ncbi:putative transcriptional regulatory protein TetR [Gordonia spumicola]|uniref:Putative transcriptional regulatory protein TetR n=1 Tax=Gordonia spumicola TaxID=589161 RepID=A0A7I9V3W9_9ACTN|nr:mycofactocin system transcriptional regulator [Gordonia spumicola]GED99871.1 putative transcriptional regulatory protein TetR [Gordonia spumicola]
MSRPFAGRPAATTRGRLSEVAIDLFTANGFDETSVDDIASAAGIARRTLFRYYPSKNSLAWGEFDDHLDDLRTRLARAPEDISLGESLIRALIVFNEVPGDYVEKHRSRMSLLLGVPALQAHSMLMYADWRQVIAEHCAARLAVDPGDHIPQTIAWMTLGTALAAYDQWLADPTSDLTELLETGGRVLVDGVGSLTTARSAEPLHS